MPSTPSLARRARERRHLRARILDTARELFAAEGYDAVTIRRVAQRIEYTPPVIYQHFADKAALIREVCDADWGGLTAELEQLAAIRDPIERLAQIGAAYVEFGLAHPNHYRTLLVQPRGAPPADRHATRTAAGGCWSDGAYGALRAAVDEAFRAGRFDPGYDDPATVAQVLWQSLHGIVSMHVTWRRHDGWTDYRDPRETSRLCLATLMRGLTCGPTR
jgi:AcrR family transcriptional regulator